MQGKEASEQETEVKCNVGIDVSKDWLDIYVAPVGDRLRVGNDGAAIPLILRGSFSALCLITARVIVTELP